MRFHISILAFKFTFIYFSFPSLCAKKFSELFTKRLRGAALKSNTDSRSRCICAVEILLPNSHAYQLTVDLDHWIRRRIRMCYWRQWRKPRTKVRSLMKLGVSERLAIACGITSKGPCRSSKTKGINIALGNNYLASQGLVSLRDIWINIHYGR